MEMQQSDNVDEEILKLLEDYQISAHTKVNNRKFKAGNLTKDWRLSIFIPIPKKNNASKCEDHRLIS